ncbi:hypothetical protein [Streptomyces sp. N35]|uniref:hypothetical protein n=1 Tax=Streptomyces sp. N35 TaxID=2795730 RepID=UPI0018F5BDD0|nr:hypothetical protein [Streptomyces sp. N35]
MHNSADAPDSAERPTLYDPPELNRATWHLAGRRLLAKMLGEFAHEEIIQPTPAPTAGPATPTSPAPSTPPAPPT